MKKLIFTVLVSVFLMGCASFSGGPVGGPMDKDAPVLVYSSPKQSAKKSKLHKIILGFDEYIQLKDPAKIVVSPPLNVQYSVNLRELRALISDTLKDNTTYTISFNGSIVDLNEGNPVENLRLIFSTGETIDSMYLEGLVYDALTLAPEPNIFVALYSESLDSFPFKNIPNYITKTDAEGYFWVQNIRNACYQLIAFDDKNFDMILDPITERMAYSSKCVEPNHLATLPPITDSTTDSLTDSTMVHKDFSELLHLYTYQDRLASAFLEDAKFTHRGFIQLKFRYPVDEIQSRLIVEGKELLGEHFWTMAEDKKSASLRWSDLSFNKAQLILSTEGNIDTTDLLLPVLTTQTKIDTLGLSLSTNANASFLFTDTLRLHLSNPIVSFEDTKIEVWAYSEKDSIQMNAKIEQKNHSDFNLILPLQQDTKYKITFNKDCFTDIYGKTNDTVRLDLTCNAEDKYGSLTIQISDFSPSKDYLFQRMDEKSKVLSQVKMPKNGKIVMTYLLPGKYTFRLIEDANNNGRWDGGDFVLKKQIEKIWYFPKLIPVERDWIIEENWSLTE